jgi:hypothetical protein
MRAQLGGDIVDAESGRGGVPNYAGDEGTQLTAVMVGRLRLLGRRGDERPDAAPRFDDAGPLELGVDAGDSVGIDAEVDGKLANGGKLVAGLESAGGNRGAKRAIELRVDGGAIACVDRNERHHGRHVFYCTNILEQVKPKKGGNPSPQPLALAPIERGYHRGDICLRWSPSLKARATTVSVGGAQPAVGNTELPVTYKLAIP